MWKEVWVIMLLIAFVCLVSSILLVFLWDIPSLIDELSGRKAKRQIKMLHELNSSTSTFDKLSTNEIYSSISSGTLLNEELHNIDKENNESLGDVKDISTSFIGSEIEESTSYLADDDSEATSYVGEDYGEDSTSFFNTDDEIGVNPIKIIILEEQSSL